MKTYFWKQLLFDNILYSEIFDKYIILTLTNNCGIR